MQICRLYEKHLTKALALVWHVFCECDREDYEEMGVRTFQHFIQYETMKEFLLSGEMVFFGAYEGNELVGVGAMRNGFHISLLFVEPEYQRMGIGRCLVRRGIAYCMEKNPLLKYVTVNASPKGVKAYLAMGFLPLMEAQKKDGMIYTPMRIELGAES